MIVGTAAAIFILMATGPTIIRIGAILLLLGLATMALYVVVPLILLVAAVPFAQGVREGWSEERAQA